MEWLYGVVTEKRCRDKELLSKLNFVETVGHRDYMVSFDYKRRRDCSVDFEVELNTQSAEKFRH
jgi:hypothetical protein